MASPDANLRSGHVPRVVVAFAAAALLIKLGLAWTTRGTNDVEAFRLFLRELLGAGAVGLYAQDPDFNHPPLVLRMLLCLRWLVNATGLPFTFWLRVPAILADLGSLWLVSRLFRAQMAEPSVRTTLALVAAAPVSILISGFHGNTDPVMVFFVLLSIYWAERPGWSLLAGAAMGLAVSVKIVPLVFWPAVLLWLPAWRARLAYFGAALFVIVLGATPVIFEAPGLLARKVVGYGSDYGVWGLSWTFAKLQGTLPVLDQVFERFGRHILVVVVLALSAWMNRRQRRPPLYQQLGAIAFTFLAVTPGFGVQYLAWLAPWVVGIPVWIAVAWSVSSGAFLVLVYTFWCHGRPSPTADPNWLTAGFWSKGLPWDEAHANLFGLVRGEIVPVAILCWLTIVLVLGVQLRRIVGSSRVDLQACKLEYSIVSPK